MNRIGKVTAHIGQTNKYLDEQVLNLLSLYKIHNESVTFEVSGKFRESLYYYLLTSHTNSLKSEFEYARHVLCERGLILTIRPHLKRLYIDLIPQHDEKKAPT